MISLDSEHAHAAWRSRPGAYAKQNYPAAKIYITTDFSIPQLDNNLFFEKEKDASGLVTQREVFGNVAETIGVKIEADEVSFAIRIGDQEETHSLKRSMVCR